MVGVFLWDPSLGVLDEYGFCRSDASGDPQTHRPFGGSGASGLFGGGSDGGVATSYNPNTRNDPYLYPQDGSSSFGVVGAFTLDVEDIERLFERNPFELSSIP